MAQQCAVAGHIAGMVQERSNVAGSEHDDHQAADDPVAVHSQRVQVPVDMTYSVVLLLKESSRPIYVSVNVHMLRAFQVRN